MKEDLSIIREILEKLNFTETYRGLLLSIIVDRFQDSGLDEISPNFIYYTLIRELGRNTAIKVANYFEQMKKEGSYESELQKLLKTSPYMQ